MKTITKAEILWTRVCPLNCSYCNMPTGQKNDRDFNFWKATADQLKKLSCRFAAFYGAEPLADIEALPRLARVLQYFSEIGIDTTIITSGVTKNLRQTLEYLHDYGLRSLTMSYDILPLDKSSEKKSSKALGILEWFKSLGARDVATVTTLTRTNFRELPSHIVEMSRKGIWTFFDLIHDDRGQPGSKCRHTDLTLDLLFKKEDFEELYSILTVVEQMKEDGFLCNTSLPFINLLKENNFQHIRNYDWHCAKEVVFPGWISIDFDGHVYPCDDFHVPDLLFSSDTIYDDFEKFTEEYRQAALEKCPGCLWNTHIDANLIKAGKLCGYGVERAKENG